MYRLVPLILTCGMLATAGAAVQPSDLIQEPSPTEWKKLEQWNGTLSRAEFEERLNSVFDPSGALAPYLKVTDQAVQVFSANNSGTNHSPPVATISFATPVTATSTPDLHPSPLGLIETVATPSPQPAPTPWISPDSTPLPSQQGPTNLPPRLPGRLPLAGLRIVIDPADIGGAWASMEDRSTFYPGFGLIQEGDLNLLVSKILSERLKQLGAEVFVTREKAEPVSGLSVAAVQQMVPQILAHRFYLLSKTFHSRTLNVRSTSPLYQKIVAEVLLTKNLEALARGEKSRLAMSPDITIILQFDATAARHRSSLPKINRNILFVSGAYTAMEITSDPHQRLRLLTKLFQNVTATETRAALAISNHLVQATGFPPVLYGNSRTTRSLTSIANNPYIVARNLLLNREHDGPVVVTEPYFMNQPETLQRLLLGDYEGTKLINGKPRPSIYREYADAVADGLLEVYGK